MNSFRDTLLCIIWGFSFMHFTNANRPANPFPNPDPDIIEGDIVMTAKEREMMRQVMDFGSYPFSKWPNHTFPTGKYVEAFIPYTLDPGYEPRDKPIIKAAIEEWNRVMGKCIYWHQVPKCRKPQNCVQIKPVKGCSSKIGKDSDKEPQVLSLVPLCLYTSDPMITILHEMEHAAGMNHEHVRYDRDEYIELITANIKEYETESEFVIPPWGQFKDMGPYDYYSITHYNPNVFAKPFFRVKQDGVNHTLIGRGKDGKSFSDLDIVKLHQLYNCKQDQTTIVETPEETEETEDTIEVE